MLPSAHLYVLDITNNIFGLSTKNLPMDFEGKVNLIIF